MRNSVYIASIVSHTFNCTSFIAQYATVPRSFVFNQRINLGLYAILSQLRCASNFWWISEELCPMTNSPTSTPMGQAEAFWLSDQSPSPVFRADSSE